MTAPYCAVCRRHVDPGEDHVTVDVEQMRTRDRNEQDSYLLHVDCAFSTFDGWVCPA